jgi:cell division septal protein FtsQ
MPEQSPEKKEPEWDREFWARLRRMQRELVMKELKKEMAEVERRLMEELRRAEEARAQLEEQMAREARRRRWRIALYILLVITALAVIWYLYTHHPEVLGLNVTVPG